MGHKQEPGVWNNDQLKKNLLNTQATLDNLSQDFITVFYNLCFLVCLHTTFGKL